MSRRYVVKMVTSWSGWTGTVWAYGCKHLASAEALFARQEVEVSPGDYSALLLIDRQEHQILRSKGTKDPVKTARLVRLVSILYAAGGSGVLRITLSQCGVKGTRRNRLRSVKQAGQAMQPHTQLGSVNRGGFFNVQCW